MKTVEMKKDGDLLNEWLQSLSVKEYPEMVDKIVSGCKVKKHTLNNWKYSLCSIPELHKDKIEEIAQTKIFTSCQI